MHLYVHNISSILARNEQVVHPKRNVEAPLGVDINIRVGVRSDEADFDKESVDILVPNTRRLFQAIKGSQKLAHEIPLHLARRKSFRWRALPRSFRGFKQHLRSVRKSPLRSVPQMEAKGENAISAMS